MLSTKRKGIQSAGYIKKQRRKFIWLSVLFVVLAAGLVWGLGFLSKAQFLQIKKINVASSSVTPLVSSADQIELIAQADIAGSWWMFPKNNTFLYPKGKIAADITKNFPRVKSVDISHEGLTSMDTLNIAITERSPFALACHTLSGTSSDSCFYIDEAGFVYAPAPQFSAGVYVHYYNNETATSSVPLVGSLFIDSTRFRVAREASDYISKMGIQVTKLAITPDDDYALIIKNIYATATSTASSIIYFNTDAPLEKTLGYFQNFWQSRANKNFAYIDLRYGKDIVFKMQ